jgi:uncharacterized membrane protein
MRQTRRPLWVVLGLSVLTLLASIATGFYGGWGPCGPATIEGMILMTVGIIGILASASLLVRKAVVGVARDVTARFNER